MAEQKRHINILTYIHGILFYIWAVLSIVVYSIFTIMFALFSRKIGHSIARAWSRNLLFFAGAKIEVRGMEKLDKNKQYVFVSNHQSHLDIPFLLSQLPFNLVFIAKKELFRIPFFGWGIYVLGHVSIDRSSARKARESFKKAVERLHSENIAPVIFPEGTRSPDGKIGPFKRGAFALPLESELSIVPVLIRGTRDMLPKKSYLIRPGKVTITTGDPIYASGKSAVDKEKVANQVREIIVGMADKS